MAQPPADFCSRGDSPSCSVELTGQISSNPLSCDAFETAEKP